MSDALRELFSEVVDLTGVRWFDGAVLGDDVPVDSQEMLRILARVEARFGFKFRPREVVRLRTVGDLTRVIDQRQGA